MFQTINYKIGDTVLYNNKLWKIERDKFMEYSTKWTNEDICSGITGEITNCNTFNNGDILVGGDLYNNGKYIGKVSPKSVTITKNANISLNDVPVIVDYKVINNTVVIFTFADGTTEKTVCNHEFDEFELNRAVELAICKKKFGGTKAYHKAVNNAIKQIEDIDAKKKAEAEEQERIAKRKAKYAERQAKRKAKRRQEQIDIQTEAFYQAMMKYDDAMADADLYTEYAPDKNVESVETE